MQFWWRGSWAVDCPTGGNNLYMTSLFPPREILVSDIPAGDGNIETLFLWCGQRHIRLPKLLKTITFSLVSLIPVRNNKKPSNLSNFSQVFSVLRQPLLACLHLKIKKSRNSIYKCKIHSTKLLTNMKKFLPQNFSLLLLVSLTPLITLIREYFTNFKKNWNCPDRIAREGLMQGKLIHEKKLEAENLMSESL